MTRMRSHHYALAVTAVCIASALGSPRSAAAQDLRQQGGGVAASVKGIAAQLGARLAPRDDDDLALGASFTSTLEDPEKLAQFGIKGMHAGARVTVARVSPEKVRIEVDEMDPVPSRGSTTVKLDAKGALVPTTK